VVVRNEYCDVVPDLLLDHSSDPLLSVTAWSCSELILKMLHSVTNTFFTAHLPMSAHVSFDNTGMSYDPTAIVTNGTFDPEKYRGYSPLYMSAALSMTYGVSFAASTAVFVHTFRMSYIYILTQTLEVRTDDLPCSVAPPRYPSQIPKHIEGRTRCPFTLDAVLR